MSGLQGWWKPPKEERKNHERAVAKFKRIKGGRDYRWAKLRRAVLRHYGNFCMRCGITGKMHVDHIKPASKFPELRYVFDNLQVLCPDCNQWKGVMVIDFRSKEADLTAEQYSHMMEIMAE